MSDPMKKVISENHPQKPRSGVLPDGKELGRNTAGSQVPEYDGCQRDGCFDGKGDAKSRDEVPY